MTLCRGTKAVRREAAVGLLVGAAVVVGLWSVPPDAAPETVTIDLQRLRAGKAAEVPWSGSRPFAGVTARGELGRRQRMEPVRAPISVSPDRRYAVTRYDERLMLVFRTDTGYPLFDLEVGAGLNRRVVWEPDGDLLLDVWHGGRVVAVRCTMTAECERAGGGVGRKSPRRSVLASATQKVSYDRQPERATDGKDAVPAERARPRERRDVAVVAAARPAQRPTGNVRKPAALARERDRTADHRSDWYRYARQLDAARRHRTADDRYDWRGELAEYRRHREHGDWRRDRDHDHDGKPRWWAEHLRRRDRP